MRIAVPFFQHYRATLRRLRQIPDRGLRVGVICGDVRLIGDGRLNIAGASKMLNRSVSDAIIF
jgi:hypothetical protein